MEKPEFILGSEERFSNFISSLKNAKKIIAVSHTDLDGLASAKVVQAAVNIDKVYLVDYHELDDNLINKLEIEKPTHIIFTDLLIRNPEFMKRLSMLAQILIIDHHVPENDLNSDKVAFLNAQGFCAAYLAYYLFSQIKSISEIDWLVACASLSDVQFKENAKWMGEVYNKYGDEFDINDERKGKFWQTVLDISNALVYHSKDRIEAYKEVGEKFMDIGNLKEQSDKVQKEIDLCISKFEKEKEKINDGYFWEFSSIYPIKSIVGTKISYKYFNKTVIIAERRDKYYLSARRQDKKVEMNKLLQKLVEGLENSDAGGHIPAAGGHILLKDVEEFKKRLKNLKKYL